MTRRTLRHTSPSPNYIHQVKMSSSSNLSDPFTNDNDLAEAEKGSEVNDHLWDVFARHNKPKIEAEPEAKAVPTQVAEPAKEAEPAKDEQPLSSMEILKNQGSLRAKRIANKGSIVRNGMFTPPSSSRTVPRTPTGSRRVEPPDTPTTFFPEHWDKANQQQYYLARFLSFETNNPLPRMVSREGSDSGVGISSPSGPLGAGSGGARRSPHRDSGVRVQTPSYIPGSPFKSKISSPLSEISGNAQRPRKEPSSNSRGVASNYNSYSSSPLASSPLSGPAPVPRSSPRLPQLPSHFGINPGSSPGWNSVARASPAGPRTSSPSSAWGSPGSHVNVPLHQRKSAVASRANEIKPEDIPVPPTRALVYRREESGISMASTINSDNIPTVFNGNAARDTSDTSIGSSLKSENLPALPGGILVHKRDKSDSSMGSAKKGKSVHFASSSPIFREKSAASIEAEYVHFTSSLPRAGQVLLEESDLDMVGMDGDDESIHSSDLDNIEGDEDSSIVTEQAGSERSLSPATGLLKRGREDSNMDFAEIPTRAESFILPIRPMATIKSKRNSTVTTGKAQAGEQAVPLPPIALPTEANETRPTKRPRDSENKAGQYSTRVLSWLKAKGKGKRRMERDEVKWDEREGQDQDQEGDDEGGDQS